MNMRVIGRRAVVWSVLSLAACAGAAAQPPGRGGPPPPPNEPPPGPVMPVQASTLDAIARAYDSVNRAVFLTSHASQGAGLPLASIVAQSKTAYQEALSRYQAGDAVGARELATAASDLSRAIEELALTAATPVSQLPPPPVPPGTHDDAFRANDDLARAGRAILDAQGALTSYPSAIPADAAAQVQALVAASRQLQQRGQIWLEQNQPRQASSAARAADALAHAATHVQNRCLMPAGAVPLAPPPLPPGPPPPDGRGRGRGPGG